MGRIRGHSFIIHVVVFICHNLFSISCSTNSGNGWGIYMLLMGLQGQNRDKWYKLYISDSLSFTLTKVFAPISSAFIDFTVMCVSWISTSVFIWCCCWTGKRWWLRVLLGPVVLLLAIWSSLPESFRAFLTHELIEDWVVFPDDWDSDYHFVVHLVLYWHCTYMHYTRRALYRVSCMFNERKWHHCIITIQYSMCSSK